MLALLTGLLGQVSCTPTGALPLPSPPAAAKTLLLIVGDDENASVMWRDLRAEPAPVSVASSDDGRPVALAYYGCDAATLGFEAGTLNAGAVFERRELPETRALLRGELSAGTIALQPEERPLSFALPEVRAPRYPTECRNLEEADSYQFKYEHQEGGLRDATWLDRARGRVLVALSEGAEIVERSGAHLPAPELAAYTLTMVAADENSGHVLALAKSNTGMHLLEIDAEGQVLSPTVAPADMEGYSNLVVSRRGPRELYAIDAFGNLAIHDGTQWSVIASGERTPAERRHDLVWIGPREILAVGLCDRTEAEETNPTAQVCVNQVSHVLDGVKEREVFRGGRAEPTAITSSADGVPYVGDGKAAYHRRNELGEWAQFRPARRDIGLAYLMAPLGERAFVVQLGAGVIELRDPDHEDCRGFDFPYSPVVLLTDHDTVLVVGDGELPDTSDEGTAILSWARRVATDDCSIPLVAE